MSMLRPVWSAGAFVVALVVVVLFAADAQAAPGDLDLTFSGDGKQTTDFGFGLSNAAAVVLQPDGKIVAVGTDRARGFEGVFALARYNPNGSLDTSFSGDGKQRTDFGGEYRATGVALQPDGKIVAVGTNGGNFALARYNPNGSLDTSFSDDGRQRTLGLGQAKGVAVQGNGRIVVAGGGASFALARYIPNGDLDQAFSGDGKQTTDFGSGSGVANGVALQADGKIVAAGADGGNFALARYNRNGSLDTSFSGDGKQTTDFFGDEDQATGVALQGNGKLVVAGGVGSIFSGPEDFALARYNPNGSLDTSFSGDGKQTTDFGGLGDQANGVALQGNGRIVAAGRASLGDFTLARYNLNGSLDTSFSGDGKQTTEFGGDDQATAVSLQDDGRIVAVGQADRAESHDFALARYNPNGAPDGSFSDDGKRRTSFGGFGDRANGVALQTDGKIVAAGGAGFGSWALARYNPNGSPDTTFSGNGRLATEFGGFGQARAVAVQDDGKIVAVGNGGGNFALARYNPNGTLDTSFSGDGKQTTGFGAANAVALQDDGKIVAAGFDGQDFLVDRYNPNGSPDTSFSGDGRETTDFAGDVDAVAGVALQGNGRVVAAGAAFVSSGDVDFALARYGPNGALDTSFSGDGKQTTDFAGFGDQARAVTLQDDGKLVAVGGAGVPGAPGDFALARYNPNGSLDPTFSGDGRQTADFSFELGEQANEVLLQDDGRIVAVGGASEGATGGAFFALARYNPNGSLDTSFSGNGTQTTDFGPGGSASGAALRGDGRIVAVGVGQGPNQTDDFALARYLGG